ncbi:WD40 repeat-containing protein [Cavenderia fasciculata]|uniref:WD40 repeat-containing protein n=1 Tax=Cavenderia fasciculata TaxID=261658 RepID=F4QBG5_CACFS|nr:WD40 repeat-containing protein [Cavenderia fasciculata]EGG14937.1 WD40 repeat-containing protein [Cavenderia fasciculata]|eukprot:XP_004351453.1 WD40 repeat-containing protein [Cavenderia fasciculata]
MVVSEVITLASKDDTGIYLYDLRNGTLQTTLTNSSAVDNGVCLIGTEYVAVSQSGKALLHLYSWNKDSPMYKIPMQEKTGPLCATSDGLYCCMGTASGTIYIWETASGALVRTWEAHYNKITTITFTRDDCFLLSGGDDGVINVWTLESLLNKEESLMRTKTSFTDHSLGITSIYCGYGGSNSRVYSVSNDRTCRVWDLVQQRAITSIVFPTNLTSVVVDASETVLYVGGGDGVIYQTDLISLSQTSLDMQHSQQQQSFVTNVSNQLQQQLKKTFVSSSSKSITALNLSFDGSLLISGTLDGQCNIWDTFSRQTVRSIASLKGAITSIQVLFNPIDNLSMNQDSNRKQSNQPLQPFEKYTSDKASSNIPIKLSTLPINNQFNQLIESSLTFNNQYNPSINNNTQQQESTEESNNNNNISNNEENIANMVKEINRFKQELDKQKKLNRKLVDQMVEDSISKGDDKQQIQKQREAIMNKNLMEIEKQDKEERKKEQQEQKQKQQQQKKQEKVAAAVEQEPEEEQDLILLEKPKTPKQPKKPAQAKQSAKKVPIKALPSKAKK